MKMHSQMFRSYILPTAHQVEVATDELAENLSHGFTLNECADRMEVSRGTACVLYCRICDRLGERAL
jgi:predicted DNA-binding protein (UPF0251 family)